MPYIVSSARTVSSIGVFPARSPIPVTVVWITSTPSATASSVFATPRPKSMWKCVSSGTPMRSRVCRTNIRTPCGDRTPKVSTSPIGIDVAVGRDALEQVEVLHQPGPRRVDREERDREPELVRQARRLDRCVDRPLDRPAVGLLDKVVARGDLHHHAVDAAVGGALHVVDHAAGEGVDLRREPHLHHLADRRLVGGRDRWEAGLDAVDAGLGERLGDPELVVLREHDARLLLPVAQGHVVDLDRGRQVERLADLRQEVPGAGEPSIGVPGSLAQDAASQDRCPKWPAGRAVHFI